MRIALVTAAALAALGGVAVAQTSTAPATGTTAPNSTTGSSNPAVTVKPKGSPESTGSLEPGSNSFTESQARSRIEAQGFANVTDLTKNDQGFWTGKAQKNGQSVNVMLDYKGNVASR